MSFRYVPILRSRSAEQNALKNQHFSDKIQPLFEIVKAKARIDSKKHSQKLMKIYLE
jgi:hypothetical protein